MSIQSMYSQIEPSVRIGKKTVQCHIDYRGRVLNIVQNALYSATITTVENYEEDFGLENYEDEQAIQEKINKTCHSEDDLESLFNRIRKRWSERQSTDITQNLSRSFNNIRSDEAHSGENGALLLPVAPPSLWKDRPPGRATNPAKFIGNHYGPWIGNGLTRALIGDLDPDLYRAYATWIRRHPEDDLKLPTRTDITTAKLAGAPPDFRRHGNLAAAARMRKYRSQPD